MEAWCIAKLGLSTPKHIAAQKELLGCKLIVGIYYRHCFIHTVSQSDRRFGEADIENLL
jgi:hypothetical protein